MDIDGYINKCTRKANDLKDREIILDKLDKVIKYVDNRVRYTHNDWYEVKVGLEEAVEKIMKIWDKEDKEEVEQGEKGKGK